MSLLNNAALLSLKSKMDEDKERVTGLVSFTRQSYGFLNEIDGGRVFFIPPPVMKLLLPNDKITALIGKENDRSFVESIVEVVESNFSGQRGKIKVVSRDDNSSQKFFVPSTMGLKSSFKLSGELLPSLKEGDWVKVDLISHAFPDSKFKLEVTGVYGNEEDPYLPWIYAKDISDANNKIYDMISATDYPYSEYADLTHLPFVTIDGESTQDMDDAICAEMIDSEMVVLYIAIADPSVLAEVSGAQFDNIVNRGVTYYLPNETIHMLDKKQSVDTFSLKEGLDKPSVLLEAVLNINTGECTKAEFKLAMIASRCKLSYDVVSDFLSSKHDGVALPDDVGLSIKTLHSLSQTLRNNRSKSQVIFQDRVDYYFKFDGYEPIDIDHKKPSESNTLVEEIMIFANSYFAEFSEKNNIPIIYSKNTGFKEGKFDTVKSIANEIGMEFTPESFNSTEFVVGLQKHLLLLISQATEDTGRVLKLESLQGKLRGCFDKSEYSLEHGPHKVMGLNSYATWTSPLRKASDMCNHLVIKHSIIKKRDYQIVLQQMVDTINEKTSSSRLAERTIKKILMAKLFTNNPSLVEKSKVIRVDKKSCLVKIISTETFANLLIRDISFNGRYEYLDEENCFTVNGEVVLKPGQEIDTELLDSDMFSGEITLKAKV